MEGTKTQNIGITRKGFVMKNIAINGVAATLAFLAVLMLAAAGGMMDQGAEISVCVKLAAGSITAMIGAAGFADLARS